ncbi:MAG: PhoH family protein [Phycisphaerae bacterium]
MSRIRRDPDAAGVRNISELVLTLDGDHDARMEIYGPGDCNIRTIRQALGIQIFARDGVLKLVGRADAVGKAAAVFEALQQQLKERGHLSRESVADTLADLSTDNGEPPVDTIEVYRKAAAIRPRTPGQQAYLRAIAENDLCFCLGPAGTGKTYLAVAMAVSLLKRGQIKRLILARPAVEAGEKLGYLPGDLRAKVNPYLRPLFDAMHDMMEYDQIKRFMVNDVIEVVPLAFMRGRTLNRSAIILDEAQNATPGQMLMFLTRLGHHSKMIVTGDDSQSDLGDTAKSGLVDATRRLRDAEGIAIVRLTQSDIVRHRLVTQIVHAYGEDGPPARAND